MADEVHLLGTVLGPQVDGENEEVGFKVLGGTFFSGRLFDDNQADTRRRCNRTPVFVAKTAHSCADRLLYYFEHVPLAP